MPVKRRWVRVLAGFLVLAILLAVWGYFYAVVGIGGASLPEDFKLEVYTDTLIKEIPVALDITPDGTIYVAQTEKFSEGVGDNRWQSFWLLDDLASNSVADREAYIDKWIAAGELTEEWFTKNADYITRIRDTDGDGLADSANTFAERRGKMVGLTSGVLVKGDDVWVTSIPDLVKYTDRNRDGSAAADETEILSTGYGLRTNFVGHDMHGLIWGPDGKIYYSIGDRGYNVVTREGRHLVPPMNFGRGAVFRMNPDGSELEVFATGLRNPQELAFDDFGNLFTGDNNSDGDDKARLVYVVEGGDSGWMSPYQFQSDDDYLRGPWNAEKMWHPRHPGQPAWIIPPVDNLSSGPSGFAHYPGVGFPARYNNHFFLADYGFAPNRSYIWSFAVTPEGAGFKLDDVQQFTGNKLVIDLVFGYDSKLYTLSANTFAEIRQIDKISPLVNEQQALTDEVQQLFQQGMEGQTSRHLQILLGHADQRVRREAQRELVARKQTDLLAAVAVDGAAPLLARLHAVWGVGQFGVAGLQAAGWQNLQWLTGQPDEVRAQVLKVVGDAKAAWLLPDILPFVADAEPRVQYFAALAAGKIGDAAAIPALVDLLRRNNDQDAYLRHVAVHALELIGNADALQAYAADPSPAVRMGVLLSQRRLGDPRIAAFLADNSVELVVEAARAIYDMPIQAALPPLAAMATQSLPVNGADEQTSYALHRRVINANLLLGDASNADALARYALNSSNPLPLRQEALAVLEQFVEPGPLDRVLGSYRAIPPRSVEVVYPALDARILALLDTELKDRAMQVALKYQRVPLEFDQLLELANSPDESTELRVASVQAMGQRVDDSNRAIALATAEKLLQATQVDIRIAALQLLAQLDGPAAVRYAIALDAGADLMERQAALRLLGGSEVPAAAEHLVALLQQLQAGTLAPEIQLDVLEALALASATEAVDALSRYHSEQAGKDEITRRSVSLYGGDAIHGKVVFENQGDCLRCHSIAGRGGNSGPDLGQAGSRFNREYLLQSMVLPAAVVAQGYGYVSLTLNDGSTVDGTLLGETPTELRISGAGSHGEGDGMVIAKAQIRSQSQAISGMPAMGLVLSPADLRDVLAYLAAQQAN